MNAFAEVRFFKAVGELDLQIRALEESPNAQVPSVERVNLQALQRIRGELFAMKQLVDLEEQVRDVLDTERPSHLRVVK